MEDEKLTRLRTIIEGSDNIVFFGGAGVSTESGIPDFRSPEGLYAQGGGAGRAVKTWPWPPEEMLSHDFFFSHTAEFFDFYRARVLALWARPNPAHLALAKMEAEGRLRAVVTQNIDGLHQAAGSKTVLELHGSVHRNTCLECGRKFGAGALCAADWLGEAEQLAPAAGEGRPGGGAPEPLRAAGDAHGIPRCPCGGLVKPEVVLYGEGLDPAVLQAAAEAIAAADTLVVGGTSLAVWPAAGLVDYFKGRHLVVVNKGATAREVKANLVIDGPIGEVLGAVGQAL